MTKEQYLRALKWHLHVSGPKKKEIVADIEADLEDALASGETMDEIIARMGSPKQLAADFHHQLGRRKLIWPWVMILCIVMGGWGYVGWRQSQSNEVEMIQLAMGTSGVFDQQVIQEKSMEIIDLMAAGQYAEVYETYFSEEVKKRMTCEQFEESMMPISKLGAMQGVSEEYYAEVTQNGVLYGVSEIHLAMEMGTVAYRLSFHEDLSLGGFYVMQV